MHKLNILMIPFSNDLHEHMPHMYTFKFKDNTKVKTSGVDDKIELKKFPLE